MTRLGLKSNREGRNREASERKGSEKGTKIGEKGHPSKGVTKKKFFDSCLVDEGVSFICYRRIF